MKKERDYPAPRAHSFRFVSFRFVSFRFVSFRFVGFDAGRPLNSAPIKRFEKEAKK